MTTAVAPRSVAGVRQGLLDTWTITLRELQHWRNRPGVIAFGWLFPVLLAGMFIGLLGGALGATTGGSYVDFVMPGVFAMAMFFGLESTMTAVSLDASKGVTERFRSLPVSGVAVLAGRCLADMLHSLVGLAVVVVAGLLFGWRPDAAPLAIGAALALLLALRFAMLWIGMFIGLRVKNQEAIVAVQVAMWPLLFLSGVFVDTATMPRWLGMIADANPLTATVTAIRDLVGAPGAGGTSWVAESAPWPAVLWPAVLVAVFLPLAARTWRRLRR
ncbi:ABC transporter permease [Prauserella oleivorans]|uniref:Transport permease protein n=1 Tax=Prauserella oleivorans TaxID=1478153 RepID=A0ABW5WDA7_9PSEU